MDPPLEKVLELSVDFSFTSSRAICRIHARSRQLIAHAQWHLHSPTALTLRPNFLGLTSHQAVTACFKLRYGKTIKVVSRQNNIKNLDTLIRNGNSRSLLFILVVTNNQRTRNCLSPGDRGIWGERIAWFSGGMERISVVSYKFK